MYKIHFPVDSYGTHADCHNSIILEIPTTSLISGAVGRGTWDISFYF